MQGKVRNSIINIYYLFPFESAIWIAGLLYLAWLEPVTGNHYSVCLLDRVGLDFCPGCGLGRSVSWLLHGDLWRSIQAHPLGVFAFVVLIFRIYRQSFNFISDLRINKNNHG